MALRPPLRLSQLEELTLPLRDLVRGAQQLAQIPMKIAEPIVSQLPEPLRNTLSEIGKKADEVYRSSLEIWRPKTNEIQQAASALSDVSVSDLSACGRVVAWAMEVALAQDDQNAPFVSETAVTIALKEPFKDINGDASATARAANAYLAVVKHGFGPPIQDLPIPKMTKKTSERLSIAAFSAGLFLLAERAKSSDEETKILSYAITISNLIADDIRVAGRDTTAIATLLRTHAEMI